MLYTLRIHIYTYAIMPNLPSKPENAMTPLNYGMCPTYSYSPTSGRPASSWRVFPPLVMSCTTWPPRDSSQMLLPLCRSGHKPLNVVRSLGVALNPGLPHPDFHLQPWRKIRELARGCEIKSGQGKPGIEDVPTLRGVILSRQCNCSSSVANQYSFGLRIQ